MPNGRRRPRRARWTVEDGRLYEVPQVNTWIPLTNAAGSPLSAADQQRLALRYQPLPGGRRLLVTYASSKRDVRVQMRDSAGKAVRTWHLTSGTDVTEGNGVPAVLEAAFDVVLPLEVSTEPPSFRWESMVVRLAATGAPVRKGRPHVDDIPELLTALAPRGRQPVTEPPAT